MTWQSDERIDYAIDCTISLRYSTDSSKPPRRARLLHKRRCSATSAWRGARQYAAVGNWFERRGRTALLHGLVEAHLLLLGDAVQHDLVLHGGLDVPLGAEVLAPVVCGRVRGAVVSW